MVDFTLTPLSFLNGYSREVAGVRLEEVVNLAIVSLAAPRGGEEKLNKSLKSAYGVALPQPGEVLHAKDNDVRLVGMSIDQAFVLFDHAGTDAATIVAKKLKNTAYVSLQSDNWVALRASGERVREALERICPLDLHPDVFGVDQAARTVMEHLGVVIVREDENTFLLLSASSSAKSFLHAVETSMEYAL